MQTKWSRLTVSCASRETLVRLPTIPMHQTRAAMPMLSRVDSWHPYALTKSVVTREASGVLPKRVAIRTANQKKRMECAEKATRPAGVSKTVLTTGSEKTINMHTKHAICGGRIENENFLVFLHYD